MIVTPLFPSDPPSRARLCPYIIQFSWKQEVCPPSTPTRSSSNMDAISKYNVVHRYQKRSLLIAVNCVAALSIFFFGYDQGVMGGVNTNRSYAVLMGFGYFDEATELVVVNHSLLQGGIVSLDCRCIRLE